MVDRWHPKVLQELDLNGTELFFSKIICNTEYTIWKRNGL